MNKHQQAKLVRVQFIRSSLIGLLKLTTAEQLEMLKYLLEMAVAECDDLARRLKAPTK